MYRNIFWKSVGIDQFNDGRARLFIDFSDDKSRAKLLGQWTPKWVEVVGIVSALVEVERKNSAQSEYLLKLQALFSAISSRIRSAADAKVILGRLKRYEVLQGTPFATIEFGDIIGSKRFIPFDEEVFEVGFPIMDCELKEILTNEIVYKWIIWNGIVIQKILPKVQNSYQAVNKQNLLAQSFNSF